MDPYEGGFFLNSLYKSAVCNNVDDVAREKSCIFYLYDIS